MQTKRLAYFWLLDIQAYKAFWCFVFMKKQIVYFYLTKPFFKIFFELLYDKKNNKANF